MHTMADHDVTTSGTYKSVLSGWDTKSAVRSTAHRLITEREQGKMFFSPLLTPCATHPLVASQGFEVVDRLLTRRLYHYLDFTTVLEQEIVNPVLLDLCRGRHVKIPKAMRIDAHRIYCDEAYHALSAADLQWQVERLTNITRRPTSEPHFAKVLRNAERILAGSMSALIGLCAAVVSETLISGTLSKLPADHSVVTPIRVSVADHASDERAHHAYFTKIFEIAWPQFEVASHRLLGPLLGEFILAFLCPDIDADITLLRDIGFCPAEALQIFTESNSPDQVVTTARHEARATLRLLHRMGVLDEPRTADHFRTLGLLGGD